MVTSSLDVTIIDVVIKPLGAVDEAATDEAPIGSKIEDEVV